MVKGLRVAPRGAHVCYCHSPPRYLWDMQEDYIRGLAGGFARSIFRFSVNRARSFDYRAAQRVTHFLANSKFVAARIATFYGRDATVIYPPVSVEDFEWSRPSEDFYLLVTQLTPYKRADLAVRTFSQMGKRLVVIGEGTEMRALRALAGPTVLLMGRQSFPVVKDHFERCRAFLYPQIEDFGITAVEAQAAGKPVIAYRAGGALETVVEGETGVFFDEQTPESLIAAVAGFEAAGVGRFSSARCRANAERFGPRRFREEIKGFLTRCYPELFTNYAWPADDSVTHPSVPPYTRASEPPRSIRVLAANEGQDHDLKIEPDRPVLDVE